jgi:deoxyadenosine/deoxycytidine kinase
VSNSITIGLIGSPGSGKTFLASTFHKRMGAKLVLELEFNFPAEIFRNISAGERLFETIVWFRNKQLAEHRQVLELASSNPLVVTDSTLYQNQLYVDLFIQDEFYKNILRQLGEEDIHTNRPLDAYVYLSANRSTILKLLKQKDPSWPLHSSVVFDYLSQMANIADEYIQKMGPSIPNLIEIKREDFDFANELDFSQLWALISNQIDKRSSQERTSNQQYYM